MNNKWFAIPITILLVATLFTSNPQTRINFVFASAFSHPDALGNRICAFYCHQWNGTAYEMFEDGYSYNGLNENSSFPAGVTSYHKYTAPLGWWTVHDGYNMTLFLVVYLNKTLASTTAEAETNSYVNTTITDGTYTDTTDWTWSNTVDYNSTYWRLTGYNTWNNVGYPVAGVIYDCDINFYAYY